jgi:hypothetical protein
LPPSPVRLHRLFPDANVLFAACRQEGRARALLKLAPRAEVLLLTPPHALEEARRNLEAKRPEALVTGDRRHFGPLMGREVRGLWAVSPAEALAGVMDLLEGKG